MKENPQPTVAQEEILGALAQIKDPDLGRDIVTLGFVKDLQISGENVSFTIELTTPACPVREQMREDAHRAVLSLPGVKNVEVQMTSQVRALKSEEKDKLLPLVKNIVPVASGKGGVGKSTVSANLAVALAKMGARVGLMDADVYGPSIPTIMGADTPPTSENGRIIPPIRYGVKIVSMGFFMPKGEATIWRGPMLAKVVDQFLGNVADTPPTSDHYGRNARPVYVCIHQAHPSAHLRQGNREICAYSRLSYSTLTAGDWNNVLH